MEEIIILHTNDLHSHLEQWPKMRRYLTARQTELRQAGKTVITVDLGDFSDRVHPLTEATNGLANTQLMNQIGYDAATIGNNEGIGNSKAELEQLYRAANFPVVLGNLVDPVTGHAPSWTQGVSYLTTPKGMRLALIGLTAPFERAYGPLGWEIQEPAAVLTAQLPQLSATSDGIVLLSHLGIGAEKELAQTFPELDVILGSHTHHLLPEGLTVGASLLAAAGKFGQYIGEVTLLVDEGRIIEKTARVIVVADLPSEAGDAAEIQGYLTKGNDLLGGRPLGNLPTRYGMNVQDAQPVVTLGLAALRAATACEVSLLNSGLFLTDLGPGIVTEKDLHECLPHPMHLIKVTLDGRDLRQLVQEMRGQAEYLATFPIVGMGFRGKIFGELRSSGLRWSATDASIWWQEELVEDDRAYTFVTVDHLMFIPFFPTMGQRGHIEVLCPDFLRNVVARYLQENYPVS